MNNRKIRNDIVALGLLAAIIFLIASLASYDPADPVANPVFAMNLIYQPDQLAYPLNDSIQNACGATGAWCADILVHTLGLGAYFLIVGLIALEVALFRTKAVAAPLMKTVGWTLSLLGFTTLATMVLPATWASPVIGPGGYLGALGTGVLHTHFGTLGCFIIALTISMAGIMMWTEYLALQAGRVVFAPAFVAATRVLPFGVLYQFVTWFNGKNKAKLEFAATDLDDEFNDLDEEEETLRTIKFRRRDLVDSDSDSESEFDSESESKENDEEAESEDAAEDEANGDSEYETESESELETDADDEEEEEADEAPIPLLKRGLNRIRGKGKKTKTKPVESNDEDEDAAEEEVATVPFQEAAPDEVEDAKSVSKRPNFSIKSAPSKPKTERETVMEQLNEAAQTNTIQDYALPDISMLLKGSMVPFDVQEREALRQATILEKTCKEFGYRVKVVEIESGPVISQYEIQLEAGLRLQKITALADDLAIALRVPSVRIVAPIPGKNTVGIEVPNESRQVVRLRDVMEQSEQQIKKQKIPLFLGKDAVGGPIVADLATLPHLLIAGRTGTGKSVCLNAIITSILMTRRPDEVRMLMIDPKMVELSGYARLPHLMHPVVTDMRKAEAILAWAVDKMEERYKLLARAGVRHLTSYNQLGQEELLERLKPENDAEAQAIPNYLPFIVIVADEIADLMMTAGKEVEQHIIRLAQKSRAVGIHLILATQKPTVDVITGLIKSNLPARIAFQVSSKMDSRVVLDAMGADKLLGMGDMLFLKPGTSMLLRGQGTYLTDDEIDRITDEVSTGEQNFVHELITMKVKEEGDEQDAPAAGLKNRDDLYHDAVDVVIKERRGSCSLLQRALGIGYGRAARLIDFMAEDGIVGDYSGSKAREVLLSTDQWDAMKNGRTADNENEQETEPLSTVSANRNTKLAASSLRLMPKPNSKPATRKAAEEEYNEEDDDEEDDDEEDTEYEENQTEALADDDYEEQEYEDDGDEDEEGEYDEEEYEDDEYEDVD